MADLQTVMFSLITLGGHAKALSYEALEAAEQQDYEKANALLKEADKQLLEAHSAQKGLVQDAVTGKKIEVDLLMVHAQDHLMNAIQIRELMETIIRLNKKIDNK